MSRFLQQLSIDSPLMFLLSKGVQNDDEEEVNDEVSKSYLNKTNGNEI